MNGEQIQNEVEPGTLINSKENITVERVGIAQKALGSFMDHKPGAGLLLFSDPDTNPDTTEVIAKAAELLGGEIFTTPDEYRVNGILMVSANDSFVDPSQGVDEYIRLEFRDGVIVSIQGGESAMKLRAYIKQSMQEDVEEFGEEWNVLRVAEFAFGANPRAKGRAVSTVEPYDMPGRSTVVAEKGFGTVHLAIGSSKHGEEGVEGFEDSDLHLDFVIPSPTLIVEMFRNERDFNKQVNGEEILADGAFRY